MGPASPERSISCEAMADIPQESSGSHCCNGFLYRPNAQQFTLGKGARFSPCRDSAACIIVMRWQRRLKSCL